uniref:HTH_48 domain-containing protein n=1 Tax=Strongyloides papillosus TaxID=174720 RepID=A0A0N5CHK1_STREA
MDFRLIYLYEFKLGQAAAKTSRKINKAFGQRSTNKRTIQRQFQKFRNRDISFQRKEDSRGINVLENEKIKRMVEHNPRITVRKLAGGIECQCSNCIQLLITHKYEEKIDSYIPHEETMTADRYCKKEEEMRKKLSDLKPALVNKRDPILFHDNAEPHVSKTTVQKLKKLECETLLHPAYSPDLSLTDYHLFKELELHLRQKKFTKSDDLKNDVF